MRTHKGGRAAVGPVMKTSASLSRSSLRNDNDVYRLTITCPITFNRPFSIGCLLLRRSFRKLKK